MTDPTAALSAGLAEARTRLAGVAHRTPVARSRTLDARTGATVALKCENLQRVGAFKFRGAWNAIARLPDEVRRRGVIAFSSGNHAQAVACVARLHGVPATIVMPSFAPRLKLDATRGYGAEVIFYDRLGENREALTERLARERGLARIVPFEDPDVIAGAGTAAAELFEDAGPLDLLVVPVGGGGLISGSAIAAHAMVPGCRVVGVEPEGGDDAVQSFRAGRRVRVEHPETIADGARTPEIGELNFEVIRRHVHDLVAVPDAALIEAMRFVFERMKLVVEPTGVLGLAAVLTGRIPVAGRRVGVILSGGNVDLAQAAVWLGAETAAAAGPPAARGLS